MALRNWSSGSSSLRLLALIVVSSTVVIFFQMKILFLEENQKKLGKLQFYLSCIIYQNYGGWTDRTNIGRLGPQHIKTIGLLFYRHFLVMSGKLFCNILQRLNYFCINTSFFNPLHSPMILQGVLCVQAYSVLLSPLVGLTAFRSSPAGHTFLFPHS